MYNLFLDDIRKPNMHYLKHLDEQLVVSTYLDKNWIVVKDYNEFVNWITKFGLPELVSFDHDLADQHYDPKTWTESFVYKEKTGADCAQFLIDYCMDNKLPLPNFLVHSQNPVGSENIKSKLERFRKFQLTGE